MRDWSFVILALIAFSCGMRSASTKFCANVATSTPEPAFKELMSFCAADLFAVVTSLDVAVALDVPVLVAAAVAAVPVVVEELIVVAMIQFRLNLSTSTQQT